jgi:hypothetical protein
VSLMSLIYVGLVAYTQVFCGPISTLIGDIFVSDDSPQEQSNLRYLSVGLTQVIFSLVVVPLSIMDLTEQVKIQSLMAAVRFATIFIMVGGSVFALFKDDQNNESGIGPPYLASGSTRPGMPNELYGVLPRLWCPFQHGFIQTAFSALCPFDGSSSFRINREESKSSGKAA